MNPQGAPEAGGKRMTLTREQIEERLKFAQTKGLTEDHTYVGLCQMALLALEAAEVLEFYGGNFDGQEGTHWRNDLLFIENKFGGTEAANDNGAQARLMLQKLRGGV